MDYMDLEVCCQRKAIKLDHPLTHLSAKFYILIKISLKFVPVEPMDGLKVKWFALI